MQSNKLKALAAAVALALPLAAQAESNFVTAPAAPAALTANARLNISVVIPRFLFLRVGTGTLLANNVTVNNLVFNVPVADVGNTNAIAATGGDMAPSQVTVSLIGNVGNINLEANAPALSNGTESIDWNQISVVPAGGATHPTINGADANFAATGRVVNVNGSWTFSYLNQTTPAEGTYQSQITYTATSL